ncbi:MAG TPA: hypothetical protein VH164_00830 [Ktedonobacteraceae bacterium]|nr:hypothetical protein [Ktedonobacteraceae bacterium]
MTDDTQQPESHDDNSSKDDMQAFDQRLQRFIDLGAEPYWMQDIRAAARKIAAQREAARRVREELELPRSDSEPPAQPEEED